MPKADDKVYFKNYHKGSEAPSLLMLILRLLMKRYTDVNQIMRNHIPNHFRSIKTVDMDIRLSVVVMISIVNQLRSIEEKMLFISSWEKMLEEDKWCKKMKHNHFNKDMILTKEDKQNFKSVDKCYICNKNTLKKTLV